MKKVSFTKVLAFSAALLALPYAAWAQDASSRVPWSDRRSASAASDQQPNVPKGAQQAEDAVERIVKRFRIGVEAGVGVDPELIMFGAHGAFAPIFHRNVEFRPGIEFGLGELTTLFGINLDVLYTLQNATRGTAWLPYIGAGPNFSLSHRGFESDNVDDGNRFDFSDTDFEAGFNFIAGARRQNGMFFEMKATAYGVANIKLLAGFNF